jgi:hypothetical protein
MVRIAPLVEGAAASPAELGGRMVLSVPVGVTAVDFNAHLAFTRGQFVSLISGFKSCEWILFAPGNLEFAQRRPCAAR